MYSVRVRDHVMIAHSFRGEVFGPAQRLHGATYVVDAEISSETLDENGIVADIGRARDALRDVLSAFDYRNLDEVERFSGCNTTTEVLARTVFDELAARMRDGLLGEAARGDPFWSLVLLYVASVVVTELITNNAAGVVMFPIAMAIAQVTGSDYMPFVVTVMVGASAGFITPIGYQTNLMVYGPGGYRWMDYVRFGTPLSIVVGIATVLIVPRVWPF